MQLEFLKWFVINYDSYELHDRHQQSDVQPVVMKIIEVWKLEIIDVLVHYLRQDGKKKTNSNTNQNLRLAAYKLGPTILVYTTYVKELMIIQP